VKRGYDPWLIVCFIGLLVMGFLSILSASAPRASLRFDDPLYYFKRQLLSFLFALPFFLVSLKLNPKFLKRCAFPFLVLVILLLILVLVPGIGIKTGEARRWIKTPIFVFQPSELAKVGLVMFLAKMSVEYPKTDLKDFLKPLAVLFMVVGLVLLEPDFGTAIFLYALGILLMFLYGWRLTHLAFATFTLIPPLIMVGLSKSYILRRFSDFLAYLEDPTQAPYQLKQAFLALAKGGLLGVGIGLGRQKFFFLPLPHVDFVLANMGEEFGFLGITGIGTAFFIIFWRGVKIALRNPDPFSGNLAIGLGLMLALQAFLNMGVVLGIFPITGLPLPFISYGGSSLLVSMVSIGLLLRASQDAVGERIWRQRF